MCFVQWKNIDGVTLRTLDHLWRVESFHSSRIACYYILTASWFDIFDFSIHTCFASEREGGRQRGVSLLDVLKNCQGRFPEFNRGRLSYWKSTNTRLRSIARHTCSCVCLCLLVIVLVTNEMWFGSDWCYNLSLSLSPRLFLFCFVVCWMFFLSSSPTLSLSQ